jgi:hypothetical protein
VTGNELNKLTLYYLKIYSRNITKRLLSCSSPAASQALQSVVDLGFHYTLRRILPSFGLLRVVTWFKTDVSGLPIALVPRPSSWRDP